MTSRDNGAAQTLRSRPRTNLSPSNLEAAIETPMARLQQIARNVSDADLQVAHAAVTAIYGADIRHVPDDVLQCQVRNAPLYRKHGFVTPEQLSKFFKGSWGEEASKGIGRSGYMMLNMMAWKTGLIVPYPADGLQIGSGTMLSAMTTNGLREGMQKKRYPPLQMSGLTPSVQRRLDNALKNMLPAGLRPELERQFLRLMPTLVAVLHAAFKGESLPLLKTVRHDVIYDAVTFVGAENLDSLAQSAWPAMKDILTKCMHGAEALKKKGLAAPSHAEIMANQPAEVLETRLAAQAHSVGKSLLDTGSAMGSGMGDLFLNKQMRLLAVPLHAAAIIVFALGMTKFFENNDKDTQKLPAGRISPQAALAIPGSLIVLETIATLAFSNLIHACDAKSFRMGKAARKEDDGRVEELSESGGDDEDVSAEGSHHGGAEAAGAPSHPTDAVGQASGDHAQPPVHAEVAMVSTGTQATASSSEKENQITQA